MNNQKAMNLSSQNTQEIKDIALFRNDSVFFFVHKKSEKIVSAIYLITNFFSSNEPLKWSLREASLSLIKDIISLSRKSLSEREGVVRSVASLISEIISLLEVCYLGGFISEMNYSVLKKELISLANNLDTRENNQKSVNNLFFNDEFFAVKIPEQTNAQAHLPQNIHKGQMSVIKDTRINRPTISKVQKLAVKRQEPAAPRADKNERQKDIIETLKKYKELGVADFKPIIKDCSEKTIQRELLSLVSKGVLKKVGERRWSRYSLV
ncbi:hypothetical protein IT397_02205 [Candidatus Nomurabacteria bacterium]|nr:hypothetical protein [Candidatus Nomurabacteria bacterium]